jgi:ADP-ribose pyrophosphatase YjhB (NUDIX family)
VINCSWGGPGRSQAEQETINATTELGSLVVAAAGNSGDSSVLYPASYDNVLSVASVTGADRRSLFSNFNALVGIAAPGEDIYSTVPRASASGGYDLATGTSMASPVVSGAAALVASRFPSLSPREIAAVLRATADDIDAVNPDYAMRIGSGRLNLLRAIDSGAEATYASIDDYTIVDANGDGIVDPGETTEQAVVRELHEETGYTAVGTPTLLLSSPILASVTSSIHHVFHVACGPRTGPGGGLADEAITVRLVPLDGLDAALAAAAAVDWHLPAALHLARAHEAIGRR